MLTRFGSFEREAAKGTPPYMPMPSSPISAHSVSKADSYHPEWFLQDYGRPPIDDGRRNETLEAPQPARRPSPIPESTLKRPTLNKRLPSIQPTITLPLRPVNTPSPRAASPVPGVQPIQLRHPGLSGADPAHGIQRRSSRPENAPQIHFKPGPAQVGRARSNPQIGQQRPHSILDSDGSYSFS